MHGNKLQKYSKVKVTVTVYYILNLSLEKSRHPSILYFSLLQMRPSVDTDRSLGCPGSRPQNTEF